MISRYATCIGNISFSAVSLDKSETVFTRNMLAIINRNKATVFLSEILTDFLQNLKTLVPNLPRILETGFSGMTDLYNRIMIADFSGSLRTSLHGSISECLPEDLFAGLLEGLMALLS